MMQQQILTLFLIIVLVGLAVWIGFEIVSFSATAANRDAVTNHLLSLGAHAKAYYRTPRSYGGGENSFEGLTIEKLTRNPETVDGEYFLQHPNGDGDINNPNRVVELTGVGKEPGTDGTPVRVMVRVFADDSVSVRRIN